MGETLTQAEIEALLSGDLSPGNGAGAASGTVSGAGGSEGADGSLGVDKADGLDANSVADGGGSGEADAGVAGAENASADGGSAAGGVDGANDEEDAMSAIFNGGDDPSAVFTHEEIDAVGEIGNISMGNSATTLFTLLNRKVNITTPTVSVSTMQRIADSYSAPLVVVRVEYTEGLSGTNLLVLRESDVMIITDLMMGGDGQNISGEITELHLSAISEAMNQMIGNASTSLCSVFDMKIDISPPHAVSVKVNEGNTLLNAISADADDPVAVVMFDLTVEGLLNTKIMQVQPFKFAKSLVEKLLAKSKAEAAKVASQAAPAAQKRAQSSAEAQRGAEAGYGAPPLAAGQPAAAPPPYGPPLAQAPYGMPPSPPMSPEQAAYGAAAYGAPPQAPYGVPPQPFYGAPPQYAQAPYGAPPGQAPYGAPPPYGAPQYGGGHAYVNVQPATFQPLDDETLVFDRKNIGLVMDVQLEVSVELGRTRKLIKDILEFGQGSIIELDKLAGEPVDILVNNKTIAKGEVVVIDESFGVRVVDIIHPSKRLA